MAKVRRFKDKRPSVEIVSQAQPDPDSTKQLEAADQDETVPVLEEEGISDQARQPSIQENSSAPSQARVPLQACQYPIQVPGVEEIMRRVHARAGEAIKQTTALGIPLQDSYHHSQPFHQYQFHFTTRPPFFNLASIHSVHNTTSHSQSLATSQPTKIELAGYSGLEDLPILRSMMKHPELNRMHSFYFRYNDLNCPAALLLVDPLLPGKRGEIERNCCNTGHQAWLYVRKRGDVKWTRDLMAERGGMRQAVYLSRCEDGWRWEQQLGDLLDCRKSLNLWIKVKT